MNNETTIAILCELKKCYLGGIADALDFAIEAVKAQEQKCRECGEATSKAIQELQMKLKAHEPNEDWISRKRLKDEIQYYIDEAGWGDEANKVLGWCMEFIDNQEGVKWDA